MEAKELARSLTEDMRTSEHPTWRCLREFLSEQSIDIRDAAMGDRFPESRGDFGIVVTRDGHVFTFTFLPGSDGDIRQRTRDVRIARWRERVEADDRYAYEDRIAAALELLRGEAGDI